MHTYLKNAFKLSWTKNIGCRVRNGGEEREEKKGGGGSPVTLRILGCLIEDGSNDLSNDCPTIPQQMICQIQRSNYLKVLGTLAANKSNDLVQQLRKSGPRLSTPIDGLLEKLAGDVPNLERRRST